MKSVIGGAPGSLDVEANRLTVNPSDRFLKVPFERARARHTLLAYLARSKRYRERYDRSRTYDHYPQLKHRTVRQT
jgi:hypothetical protein